MLLNALCITFGYLKTQPVAGQVGMLFAVGLSQGKIYMQPFRNGHGHRPSGSVPPIRVLRALREPLVWFFVIGAILFVADAYFSDEPNEVVVDAGVRDRLGKLWQTQTGNPVTPQELDSLVKNWIKEEVMFREALRLGLDRDDSIVRRRLVQKLEFLVEEVEAETVERQSLEDYYRENIAHYSLPLRYSFSHIYFTDESKSSEIQLKLEDGDDWRKLGEPSMLNDSYVARSEKEIIAGFGREFAGQLGSLKRGQWIGPVKSSYGFHLVKLEHLLPEEATPLASIERKVLADYRQSQLDAAKDDYYRGLLQKYQVVFE